MNRIFTERTLAAAFLKIGIEDALAEIKPFMANNKKMAENFFASAIDAARKYRHTHNPYYGMSITYIKDAFQKFGICNGIDLVNALTERKNDFSCHPLLLSGVKKIKMPRNGDGNKKQFKSYKQSDGLDPERTLAIRSQYGQYGVLFYKFTGMLGKDSAHQLNLLKMQFHFDTGCPYYQVRPILLSSWYQLDEEHKLASSPVTD